eukprot:31310-Pelagococcus_subviridis.AAC.16
MSPPAPMPLTICPCAPMNAAVEPSSVSGTSNTELKSTPFMSTNGDSCAFLFAASASLRRAMSASTRCAALKLKPYVPRKFSFASARFRASFALARSNSSVISASTRLQTRHAVNVVHAPSVRARQDLVRLVQLVERLGRRLARRRREVLVRVGNLRERAIRALDVVRARVARHVQVRVQVAISRRERLRVVAGVVPDVVDVVAVHDARRVGLWRLDVHQRKLRADASSLKPDRKELPLTERSALTTMVLAKGVKLEEDPRDPEGIVRFKRPTLTEAELAQDGYSLFALMLSLLGVMLGGRKIFCWTGALLAVASVVNRRAHDADTKQIWTAALFGVGGLFIMILNGKQGEKARAGGFDD